LRYGTKVTEVLSLNGYHKLEPISQIDVDLNQTNCKAETNIETTSYYFRNCGNAVFRLSSWFCF